MLHFARYIFAAVLALTLPVCAAAAAQDQAPPEHPHDMAMPMASEGWTWSPDANVFFGYNYQQRHFADFSAWESQNWMMLAGEHRAGAGRLSIHGMLSLEPFTIAPQGSPQLFQTGESYQRVPLVNFQHQHDLLMDLGVNYRLPRGRVAYLFAAALVGSPALGPTAFMHRESARDDPAVPITHHFVDATHITPGVVTTGISIGTVTLEASAFRGAEPDENRTNIERPGPLDSWSARAGWRRGAWQAQVSGGRLHQPEFFEPYDVTRLTASIGFEGRLAARPFAATLVWGENREDTGFNGTSDGYLLEWDLRSTGRSTVYGRAEVADKELFGLGAHPKGFSHPHVYYKVGALTLGYVHDLPLIPRSRFGVGGDVTLYDMPPALLMYYASSHSFHVFLRWRPIVPAAHVH